MNPGIIKISYFRADELPDLTLPVILSELNLPSQTVIYLVGVGTMVEEINASPLGSDISLKLQFVSQQEIPLDIPIAFKVEDADGNSYLIGNAPPHCGMLNKSAQINKPAEAASVNYYSFSIPIPKLTL